MNIAIPFLIWISMLACWLVGRRSTQEEVIEATIDTLIQKGYLKASVDKDGEIILEKFK